MNTGLSQLTLDTFAAFSRRRRMLIAVRGLCAAIVSLLAIMSIIALIDGLFVIRSQSLRWTLTFTGYAIVLLTVWLFCLRSLLRIPGSRDLARFIEHREPGLRDELLSAVELGASPEQAQFDSPLFRSLLQASVESKMSRIEVPALLPSSLIKGAALFATGALAICIALLLVPDLHFASRLTRAMLPSALVDRIASVKVKIIAPESLDLLVPHNDAVNVIVELAGSEADVVTLETFHSDGDEDRSERIVLKAVAGDRRFAGAIQMGRSAVQYRILAGDAITRIYTIDTAPRPHPVQFAKTYTPPAYTDLPSKSEIEKHGHLQGLVGTSAAVIIDTDQPIQSGELRFEADASPTKSIPLEAISSTQWRATIPLTSPMLCRVHLIAAETGFDNALDPPFEIKTTPDFPPKLTVTSPDKDALLPPAQPVQVALIAKDDLGLDIIHRHHSINGGPWLKQPLITRPGLSHQIDEAWDLYDLNLLAGDQLAIKFSASDRAGQTTESAPVLITIAAAGFDLQRLAGIAAKRKLLDAIQSMRLALDQEAASFKSLATDHAAAGQLQQKQIITRTALTLKSIHDEADQAKSLAKQALRVNANRAGASADQLLAISRVLSCITDEKLARALSLMALESGQSPDALSAIASDFAQCASLALQGEAALSAIIAVDEADAILRDLLALREAQEAMNLADQPDHKTTWQRAARQQHLAFAQLKQIHEATLQMTLAAGSQAKIIKTIADDLKIVQDTTQRQLAREPSKATLLESARLIQQGLDRAIAQVLPMTRSLLPELKTSFAAVGTDDLALHRLTAPWLATSNGDDADPSRHADAWTAAQRVLQTSEAAITLREDGSPLHAADVALFRRALEAIRQRAASAPLPQWRERMVRVSDAMRILEVGHDLIHLQIALAAQAQRESRVVSMGDAVTHSPLQWQHTQAQLPRFKQAAQSAVFPAAISDILTALPRTGAALTLDVEMTARRYKAQVTKKRADALDELAASVASVQPTIIALVVQARAELAAQIPSLPDQLSQLAQEARALQAKAEQARDQVKDTGEKLPQANAQALTDQQKTLDEHLAQLNDALRHDANTQDPLTEQGRERARDGDDAMAMVRDGADKARAAVKDAAAATQPDAQEQLADKAATKEAELASTLDELAKHYENLAAGEGEKSRSALRQAESDLGLKRQMDAQHGPMDKLAKLAEMTPQEQKAQLEKEAAQNPQMQKELSAIAKEAVAQAKEAMQRGASEEARLAEQLAQAQKADDQPRPDASKQMSDLQEQAKSLAAKAAPIAQQASKGTANDAAQSAKEASDALAEAGQVKPPADKQDQKEAAKKARELADALKDAADKLKQTQKQAEAALDRLRKEEGKATATLAVGSADAKERQQAAETLLHSRSRQEAAKRAAAEAKDAGQKAQALADDAQKMASDLSQSADAGKKAIADAKEAQPKIAQSLDDAKKDLARAALHEERADNDAAATKLSQSQENMQTKAGKAIDDAAKALAKSEAPAGAQAAVAKAGESLKEQADALNQMLQQSSPAGSKKDAAGNQPGNSPNPTAQDEAAAKLMARALDALDRAESNPAGDKPPSSPSSSPASSPGSSAGASPSPSPASPSPQEQAAQALEQAAKAQARAMVQSRQPAPSGSDAGNESLASKSQGSPSAGSSKGDKGQSPGGTGEGAPASGEPMPGSPSKPGDPSASGTGQSGNGNRGNASAGTADLPELDPAKQGEWGKLPPRLARDLLEGQREEVAAEYRKQVEAYFRAIAQKARVK